MGGFEAACGVGQQWGEEAENAWSDPRPGLPSPQPILTPSVTLFWSVFKYPSEDGVSCVDLPVNILALECCFSLLIC